MASAELPPRVLLPVRPAFVAFSLAVALVLELAPWGSRVWVPDFVALVLAFWCTQQPRLVGVTVAWLLGLVVDVAHGTLFGQHALAYALLGFASVALRRRLQRLAPSVRVGWVPSSRDDNIDALRNGRSQFVIDIEGAPLQAPDLRVLKLGDDRLVTLARPGHNLGRGKPKAEAFAACGHIAVNGLPTIDRVDRELAARKLSCAVTSRVSSMLVGLLLALNSDALLTVPASLAAILERQFGLKRVGQPFGAIPFPLRLMWHSSYDRDECHAWVRAEFAKLAGEME